MELTLEQRIDNGVRFLNERFPGWVNQIDISDGFDMLDSEKCVLGSVAIANGSTYYTEVTRSDSFDQVDYAFVNKGSETSEEVSDAWVRRIQKLRGQGKIAELDGVVKLLDAIAAGSLDPAAGVAGVKVLLGL